MLVLCLHWDVSVVVMVLLFHSSTPLSWPDLGVLWCCQLRSVVSRIPSCWMILGSCCDQMLAWKAWLDNQCFLFPTVLRTWDIVVCIPQVPLLRLSDHCCCWCCGNADEDVFEVCRNLYPMFSFLCTVACCTEIWICWCSCCLLSFLHKCWVCWVLYAHVCCELVFPFIECWLVASVCWWFQLQLVHCSNCVCCIWICWCGCWCLVLRVPHTTLVGIKLSSPCCASLCCLGFYPVPLSVVELSLNVSRLIVALRYHEKLHCCVTRTFVCWGSRPWRDSIERTGWL